MRLHYRGIFIPTIILISLLIPGTIFTASYPVTLTYSTASRMSPLPLEGTTLNTTSAQRHFNTGVTLSAQGNHARALAHLRNAAGQKSPLKIRIASYIAMGRSYRAIKNFESSLASLKNAEVLLSTRRGELFADKEGYDLHKTLIPLYNEMSLTFLAWNKYASAIVYLWQSRRIGGEPYRLEETTADITQLTPLHKSLLQYPLYKMLTATPKADTRIPSHKRFFRSIDDGDASFQQFRERERIAIPLFTSPMPVDEVKSPEDVSELFEVQYTEGGTIMRIIHHSKEAEDFNITVSYRNGRPESTLTDAHTYHYRYLLILHERNVMKYIAIITLPTQTDHYGFMPDVTLYAF